MILAAARSLDFVSSDAWLMIVGVLAAVACAIPGTFLMLRRLSLMGDAISHAVLPGIVVAYLLTESRAGGPVFVGAVVVGLATAFLTETLRRFGKVDESASTGVVFTTLFAIGLVLISNFADKVDLDPNCVLNGNLESVPMQVIGSTAIPQSVLWLGIVMLANAGIVFALFKEFRICSFDAGLASTLGFNPTMIHYLLMTMTALTCVVAFEAVGSILVVALLIVPAAAAHLLTDRLLLTLLLAMGIAAGSAVLGQWVALEVAPPLVASLLDQPRSYSLNITGMTATITGLILVVSVISSPRHGVVVRIVRRLMLKRQIATEDVLGALYRHHERAPNTPVAPELLRSDTALSQVKLHAVLGRLQRSRHIERPAGGILLTASGSALATRVLRSHRLWETYLADVAAVKPDHTHESAHRLEHVAGMSEALSHEMHDPALDPQAKPIPPAK